MSIRKFKENDLTQIFDIYAASKLDELSFEPKTFTLLPLDRDSGRLSQLMESDIYLYQDHEKISGYGAVCGDEIRALFVRPECRGKGIGRMLLEFLLSRTNGRPSLYVARSNEPAKRLYRQYGFKVTDTFKSTYNQQPVFAQKMVRTETT